MVADPTNQSSVPLVRHDLSDLGSEILIRILPKERTLKRYNRVYILSCKHSYRPMRARVVAQLCYKIGYCQEIAIALRAMQEILLLIFLFLLSWKNRP